MATNTYTVFDGEIVEENRNGTIRSYVPDSLGSTRVLLDDAQAQTDTWNYWPYGETQSRTGNAATPFTFVGTQGYRKSFSTDAVYIRARSYLPSIGLWMTIDATWPDQAPYSYALLSPVMQSDPTGNDPPGTMKCKDKVVGFATAFTYGCYCGSAQKQKPGAKIKPVDCIDSCCLTHDRCLEAHYGAGRGGIGGYCAHKCCDDNLEKCASKVMKNGCCDQSPNPAECKKAAKLIFVAFAELSNLVFGDESGWNLNLYLSLLGACCQPCLKPGEYNKHLHKYDDYPK